MTSPATQFIDLPFPVRRHPETARIETSVREWAQRFRLVRSAASVEALARCRYGEAAAYIYPAVELPEARLAGDLLTWLFLADDQYEEGACRSDQQWSGVIEAVRRALDTGAPAGPHADTPLIRALCDISRRLDALASPAWKGRFVQHLLDTMAAALREIHLREGGIPPSLDEYVELRRHAGAVLIAYDVIEVLAHAELPEAAYHSAVVQEITVTAVDILCWINDLYSLHKEIACGTVANLVLVLQHEDQLDQDRAFTAARALIDDRVIDLVAAEQHLPDLVDTLQLDATSRQAVHRYVVGIHDHIAGFNHWHARSNRYRQPPSATATHSTVEDLFNHS